MDNKTGLTLIVIAVAISLIALVLVDPIAQNPEYHQFSDSRSIWHIPNFWNVVSNIPFFVVGVVGLISLSRSGVLTTAADSKAAYYLFFTGVTLVSAGSSYYHLWPNNNTLVWDRLPMTIAFMSLFSIIVSEFISTRLGNRLLILFILCGMCSVFYWQYTELTGRGDLRFYAVVQFLPMVTISIILVCYQSMFTHAHGYWLLLSAYIAAKFLEHFDSLVHSFLGGISGHSVKHVVAALGVYLLLRSYQDRKITSKT